MPKRKLVLEEHEDSVLVGVLQDGCDPVIKTVEGDLEKALDTTSDFLKEAQEKWATSPRMPASKPPVEAKAKATPAPAEAAKPTEELPLLAGEEKPAEEKAEAPVEEKAEGPAAPAEVTEPVPEPEPVAAAAPVPEPEAAPSPPTPPAEAKPSGEWEYYLKDGRGPFSTVQEAMDAMGLDKATRPQHNRWDRLSTQLKDTIQRRPKA